MLALDDAGVAPFEFGADRSAERSDRLLGHAAYLDGEVGERVEGEPAGDIGGLQAPGMHPFQRPARSQPRGYAHSLGEPKHLAGSAVRRNALLASARVEEEGLVDEQRRRRMAENEALYRSVNEKIEAISDAFGPANDEKMRVVCECGRLDCMQAIELEVGRYERVRSDPTLFIVVPGHDFPEVEVVVEEHENFAVVCKNKPVGREVAIETDPRS